MSKILSYTIDAREFHRLEEVERKFNDLIRLIYASNPKFVTVTMIANVNGYSRQEAINKPWLLPNFGIVEFQGKPNRKRFWHFEEYLDWVAIPEEERRRMYKNNLGKDSGGDWCI